MVEKGKKPPDNPSSIKHSINKSAIKREVLVIDDEEIIRSFLQHSLMHAGYNVLCVENSSEAIIALSQKQFDVVLADIILPGEMNGIGLLEKIKSVYKDIPVIMITGVPNVETASEALRLGAYDYITKPINIDNLLSSIENAIILKTLNEEKRKKERKSKEYLEFLEKEIEQRTRELRITQENYQGLIERIPVMTCIMDKNRRFLQVNKTMYERLGYSLEKMLKMKIDSIVPEKYHETLHKYFKEVFVTGESKVGELEFITIQGGVLDVEIYSTAVKDTEGGELRFVHSFVRDITEYKNLLNKLLEIEKQTTLVQIAGYIGHEMNNIVVALMGYTELAKENTADKELIKKVLEIFETQAHRLQLLSANLLTLSSSRDEKPTTIFLNKVAEKTLELLMPTDKLKNCSIIKDFNSFIPPVLGDEMKFQQLLTNLIFNASDATENQGGITIGSKFHQEKNVVELFVKDNGCGIPNENIKKIFRPFFTTKPWGKGTGLGMFVVEEIVSRFKGEIEIESQVGVGTKVSIFFPLAAIEEGKVENNSEKN